MTNQPNKTQRIEIMEEIPGLCQHQQRRMDRVEVRQDEQDRRMEKLEENDVKIWDTLESLSRDVAGIVGQLKVQTVILGIVGTAVLGWLLTKI